MAAGKSFSFLKAKTETFLTQLLTMQNNFESFEEAITVATGNTFQSIGESSLSGGCINQASKISGKDGRDFFVKRNSHAPSKRPRPTFGAFHVVVGFPACVKRQSILPG